MWWQWTAIGALYKRRRHRNSREESEKKRRTDVVTFWPWEGTDVLVRYDVLAPTSINKEADQE